MSEIDTPIGVQNKKEIISIQKGKKWLISKHMGDVG